MKTITAIAVDGPSGAGKSVLAQALATRLHMVYVDTGALYRAVGLYVFRKNIKKEDCAEIVATLPEICVDFLYQDGTQLVLLNGENVSEEIRMPEISMYASAVSAVPEVRVFLLDFQKNSAKKHRVVMDGRDIGTVILPNADVKIFLTATTEERARRRHKELQEKGVSISYEQVLRELLERDSKDSSRAIAPAIPAEDAIILDNTGMNEDQTIQRAMEIIQTISEKE